MRTRPTPRSIRPQKDDYVGTSAVSFYTPQDLHTVAMAILGEAGNQSEKGKAAVAHVIANRANAMGISPAQAVLQPQQFSFANSAKMGRAAAEKAAAKNTPPYQQALQIANTVLAGQEVDPTLGATFYHANYVSPAWSADYDKLATIGAHEFYGGQQATADLLANQPFWDAHLKPEFAVPENSLAYDLAGPKLADRPLQYADARDLGINPAFQPGPVDLQLASLSASPSQAFAAADVAGGPQYAQAVTDIFGPGNAPTQSPQPSAIDVKRAEIGALATKMIAEHPEMAGQITQQMREAGLNVDGTPLDATTPAPAPVPAPYQQAVQALQQNYGVQPPAGIPAHVPDILPSAPPTPAATAAGAPSLPALNLPEVSGWPTQEQPEPLRVEITRGVPQPVDLTGQANPTPLPSASAAPIPMAPTGIDLTGQGRPTPSSSATASASRAIQGPAEIKAAEARGAIPTPAAAASASRPVPTPLDLSRINPAATGGAGSPLSASAAAGPVPINTGVRAGQALGSSPPTPSASSQTGTVRQTVFPGKEKDDQLAPYLSVPTSSAASKPAPMPMVSAAASRPVPTSLSMPKVSAIAGSGSSVSASGQGKISVPANLGPVLAKASAPTPSAYASASKPITISTPVPKVSATGSVPMASASAAVKATGPWASPAPAASPAPTPSASPLMTGTAGHPGKEKDDIVVAPKSTTLASQFSAGPPLVTSPGISVGPATPVPTTSFPRAPGAAIPTGIPNVVQPYHLTPPLAVAKPAPVVEKPVAPLPPTATVPAPVAATAPPTPPSSWGWGTIQSYGQQALDAVKKAAVSSFLSGPVARAGLYGAPGTPGFWNNINESAPTTTAQASLLAGQRSLAGSGLHGATPSASALKAASAILKGGGLGSGVGSYGGYQGGTYGGYGGSQINQGVGGAFRNR